jgi:hypothetical protein
MPPEIDDGADDVQRAAATLPGQQPPANADDGQASAETTRLRREAARYRTSLRDTEAERDGLRDRLNKYRRQDVDALVANRLANADDLFLVSTMDDLVNDDGDVDPEKVGAAVDAALEARPHWASPPAERPDFGGGARPGHREAPSFGEALKQSAAGGE